MQRTLFLVLSLAAAPLAQADCTSSAGSCYDMTTHVVSCNVAESACSGSTNYYYAPGYTSSYSGCCHCYASCADTSDGTCSYYDDCAPNTDYSTLCATTSEYSATATSSISGCSSSDATTCSTDGYYICDFLLSTMLTMYTSDMTECSTVLINGETEEMWTQMMGDGCCSSGESICGKLDIGAAPGLAPGVALTALAAGAALAQSLL